MRVLVLLPWLLAVAECQSGLSLSGSEGEFREWKREHVVEYQSDTEHQARLRIFQENKLVVEEHNKKHARGESTFKMGMTKFADLTNGEFIAKISNPERKNLPEHPAGKIASFAAQARAPFAKDWRAEGAVTMVKNQGDCGSCWSFGATGALEGAYIIANGTLDDLGFSEQQLVSCDMRNDGCNGGWTYKGFEYWQTTGANLEKDYLFISGATDERGVCKTDQYMQYAWVSKYFWVPRHDEVALKQAVGTVGPVATGMQVTESFKLYDSGIYSNPDCDQYDLNHEVLIVGYGTNADGKYWIIKNTWSHRWGMEGYAYMARNKDNMCGIATDAVYPLVTY